MTSSIPAVRLGAVLLLAACAPPPSDPPTQPVAADISGPGLPLRMEMTGQPARMLLERVAASCWLDHVVGGGSMIVDRGTGRVVITSDTADLLVAEIAPAGDGTSLVRLTGPAADDPATVLRLSDTLETAVTTGQTACGPVIG
jgi:hypothetical protein